MLVYNILCSVWIWYSLLQDKLHFSHFTNKGNCFNIMKKKLSFHKQGKLFQYHEKIFLHVFLKPSIIYILWWNWFDSLTKSMNTAELSSAELRFKLLKIVWALVSLVYMMAKYSNIFPLEFRHDICCGPAFINQVQIEGPRIKWKSPSTILPLQLCNLNHIKNSCPSHI